MGEALDEIERIGRACWPREACGLILPVPDSLDRIIIELPNRSLKPETEYWFHAADVRLALEAGKWSEVAPEELWDEVKIWHTHPGGAIGPSDEDLRNKYPDLDYLVVALHDDGEITPTWF